MNSLYDRIQKIGRVIDGTDLRIIKLGEEFGELCEAYLKLIEFKDPKGKTKEELENHLLEEGCDTLIMIMDILAAKGFTREDIIKMTNKKLDKWERQL